MNQRGALEPAAGDHGERLIQRLGEVAPIPLKSFDDGIYHDLNGGRLQPIMDTLSRVKEDGVWLEVINQVIPTYADDLGMIRRMCDWHLHALGPDTPLHFQRSTPLYKLVHLPPTPVDVLVKPREGAMKANLRYVYIGNVPGLIEELGQRPLDPQMPRRMDYGISEDKLGILGFLHRLTPEFRSAFPKASL